MSPTPASLNAAGMDLLLKVARRDLGWFHQLTHPCVSYAPYVPAQHLRGLAYALERLARGEFRRLLIAVPPRHFKSSVASVALPAYLLGLDPTLKVVCASYGLDPAREFASQSLQIMQSPLYSQLFPKTQLASKKPALELLRTKHAGYRLATSIDGPLTGKGADVIIVDDPMKAGDAYSAPERERVWQWFTTSLMTRFDKPAEGRIVVVMQRLHQEDLIGRLMADPDWEVLEFPAETLTQYMMYINDEAGVLMKPGELLFPQRFGPDELAKLRKDLGEAGYNAQMLQRPMPAGAGIFQLAKVKRFALPAMSTWYKSYPRLALSVDPAGSDSQKADYSAITWWGINSVHADLLHAVRGQWLLPELLARVRGWRKGVDGVIVETSGIGLSLFSVLRDDRIHGVWSNNATKSKDVRAAHANLLMDQGVVRLPAEAPWLDCLEAELSLFPQSKNDDYVDSVSQVAVNLGALRAQLAALPKH